MTDKHQPSRTSVEQAPGHGEQSIEQLQKRYEKLHKRQIEAGERLRLAQEQLEILKRDARQQYGTDDVAALRATLKTMTAENEERRRKYQTDLDRIETALAEVEENFSGAEEQPANE
jgi:chromosome segregation ATPase